MYSADDIVGLVLYARRRVPIYRYPSDANNELLGYIEQGQAVGKVYIYLEPQPGRKNLWWQFIDKNGNAYHSEQRPGYYSVKQIRDQGGLTKEEKLELEKEQNKTPVEKITEAATNVTKMAVRGVLIYGAMKIGLALLKE